MGYRNVVKGSKVFNIASTGVPLWPILLLVPASVSVSVSVSAPISVPPVSVSVPVYPPVYVSVSPASVSVSVLNTCAAAQVSVKGGLHRSLTRGDNLVTGNEIHHYAQW